MLITDAVGTAEGKNKKASSVVWIPWPPAATQLQYVVYHAEPAGNAADGWNSGSGVVAPLERGDVIGVLRFVPGPLDEAKFLTGSEAPGLSGDRMELLAGETVLVVAGDPPRFSSSF